MTYPSFNRRVGERRKTLRLAPGVIQGPAWRPDGFAKQDELFALTRLQVGQLLVIFVVALIVAFVMWGRS